MPSEWAPEFTHKDLEILKKKVVYNGYCQVNKYSLRFRLFQGGMSDAFERESLIRGEAAAVLLYDKQKDKVVLIEQIRIGPLGSKAEEKESPWILDVVAGMIDAGETAESTIKRESIEESGFTILNLIPITRYWVSPGISNEQTSVFCGLIDIPDNFKGPLFHGLVEHGEDIKVHIMSRELSVKLLGEGKIRSASAIIALQWLQLNYQNIIPAKRE